MVDTLLHSSLVNYVTLLRLLLITNFLKQEHHLGHVWAWKYSKIQTWYAEYAYCKRDDVKYLHFEGVI